MGMATRTHALWRQGFLGLIFFTFGTLAFTTATSKGVPNPNEEKSFLAGSNVPDPVRAVLQRACQDCHSKNTTWPWYSEIPLVSQQIHEDVARARSFMDFSKWNDYTEVERRGFTIAIGAAIQGHLMPPAKYRWMHPKARLSAEEIDLIRAWTQSRAGFSPRGISAPPVRHQNDLARRREALN
jgi:hypothetical protein